MFPGKVFATLLFVVVSGGRRSFAKLFGARRSIDESNLDRIRNRIVHVVDQGDFGPDLSGRCRAGCFFTDEVAVVVEDSSLQFFTDDVKFVVNQEGHGEKISGGPDKRRLLCAEVQNSNLCGAAPHDCDCGKGCVDACACPGLFLLERVGKAACSAPSADSTL